MGSCVALFTACLPPTSMSVGVPTSHQELYGPASETHELGASANLISSGAISTAFKGTQRYRFWAAAAASQSLHSLEKAKGNSWRPRSARKHLVHP